MKDLGKKSVSRHQIGEDAGGQRIESPHQRDSLLHPGDQLSVQVNPDDEETAVLANQVEVKHFSARQRIYKIGDPGGRAYVVVSGMVRVTTVDEDGQEVVVDEPASGEFFGFASMLEETTHQSGAIALEESVCLEVDRHDISILLQRKPLAGMDMLAVLGRQFHASQKLVRVRAARNLGQQRAEMATAGLVAEGYGGERMIGVHRKHKVEPDLIGAAAKQRAPEP